jgi:hypothetical protein
MRPAVRDRVFMEWLLPGPYWVALPGSYEYEYEYETLAPASPAWPTEADLWLIRIAYQVMAAESRCARCGAVLRGRVRLVVSLTRYVRVTTRCAGWRRHRYAAVVTEPAGDLMLCALLPR